MDNTSTSSSLPSNGETAAHERNPKTFKCGKQTFTEFVPSKFCPKGSSCEIGPSRPPTSEATPSSHTEGNALQQACNGTLQEITQIVDDVNGVGYTQVPHPTTQEQYNVVPEYQYANMMLPQEGFYQNPWHVESGWYDQMGYYYYDPAMAPYPECYTQPQLPYIDHGYYHTENPITPNYDEYQQNQQTGQPQRNHRGNRQRRRHSQESNPIPTPRHLPSIVDSPASYLRTSEKAEYEAFKNTYRALAKPQATYEIPAKEMNSFRRVLGRYAYYAGIPKETKYTLATLDGKKLQPRSIPTSLLCKATNVAAKPRRLRGREIRKYAYPWIRFYQSEEWDRTSSWSSLERVTLLDKSAIHIGTIHSQQVDEQRKQKQEQEKQKPESKVEGNSEDKTDDRTESNAEVRTDVQSDVQLEPTSSPVPMPPLPNIHVPEYRINHLHAILMHHIPLSPGRTSRGDGEPCFASRGDIIHTYTGERECRVHEHRPTLVTCAWRGEVAFCGYKFTEGAWQEKIVRARLDVGTMFRVVDSLVRRRDGDGFLV